MLRAVPLSRENAPEPPRPTPGQAAFACAYGFGAGGTPMKKAVGSATAFMVARPGNTGCIQTKGSA
jgi:hypothetical protein